MATNKDDSEIGMVEKFTEEELITLVDQGVAHLVNEPLSMLEFLEEFAQEKD